MNITFNQFTQAKYPYLDDSYIDNYIPVAYGKIASVQLTPINSNNDTDNGDIAAVYRMPDGMTDYGTAYVKIDDTDVAATVSKVDYDTGLITISNGRADSGSTYDCILKDCYGYMFDGHCYPRQALQHWYATYGSIQYTDSNFNKTEWVAALDDTRYQADFGLLLDDYSKDEDSEDTYDLDYFNKVVYNIATFGGKMYCRVDYDLSGKVTATLKDYDRAASDTIASADIEDTDELSASTTADSAFAVIVEKYYHNTVDDNYLSLEDNTYERYVKQNYRIMKTKTDKSYLINEADAKARAAELALEYKYIPVEFTINVRERYTTRLYDVVTVALMPDNLDSSMRQYAGNKDCLVTGVKPVPDEGYTTLTIQIIPDRTASTQQAAVRNSAYTTVTREKSSVQIITDNLATQIDNNLLLTGNLTVPSITVVADSSGTVSDFSSATGTFNIFYSGTDVTGDGPVYSVVSQTGCTGTIDASTGVYAVNALSADVGILLLKATYEGKSIETSFTVTKAYAGAAGTNGTNGTRTASIEMYKWASSAPTTYPVGTSTYTWATGAFANPATPNGWSQTIGTGASGQTLYRVRAVYADTSTAATSSITWPTTPTLETVSVYGADAVVYSIEASVLAVAKSVAGVFSPATVTFNFYKTTGSTKTANSNYYKILGSNDGTTWTVITSGTIAAASATCTPTAAYTMYKCEQYLTYSSGTFGDLKDSETVHVVSDGATGTSATSIVCGNENQTIACTSDGLADAAQTITIPFAGYTGTARAACTVTYSTLPTGVTLTTNTAATTSADGSLVFTVANDATLGGASITKGAITLTFVCNGVTFVKTFNWTKQIAGATGAAGRGISSTTVTYQVGTSGTTAPTGTWTTVIPTPAEGQYLWTKVYITYTDTTNSTSYSVAYAPSDGNDGTGIASTAITYQLGTSGTTVPTGTWTTAIPTPIQGQYLWARTIFTYTDATTKTVYSVSYIATNGSNGTRTAILEVYKWASSTPTSFPSGTSVYTWASGTFTAPTTANGWSINPGASTAGYTLYACQVKYADALTTTTSTVTWNTRTAYAVGAAGMNGTNGVDSTAITISDPDSTTPESGMTYDNKYYGIYSGIWYKWSWSSTTTGSWAQVSASTPPTPAVRYSFDEMPDLPDASGDLSGNVVGNIHNYTVTDNGSGSFTCVASGADPYLCITKDPLGITAPFILCYDVFVSELNGNAPSSVGYMFYTDGTWDLITYYLVTPSATEWRSCRILLTPTSGKTVSYIRLDLIADASSATSTVLLKNIYVGYGATSQPIIDNVSGAHNSTAQAGVVSTTGVSGKACQFVGLKGILQNWSEYATAQSWYNSFWIKGSIPTSEQIIYYFNLKDYAVCRATGHIDFSIFNGQNILVMQIASNLIFDGSWHHIVVSTVISSSSLCTKNIYIDTILNASAISGYDFTNVLFADGAIGSGSSITDRPLVSALDDFQFGTGEITASEVLGLYLQRASAAKLYQLANYQNDQAANDGVISTTEKTGVLSLYKTIYGLYTAIIATAAAYGVSHTSLDTSYNTLYAYLYTSPGVLVDFAVDTTITAATYQGLWTDFYAKYSDQQTANSAAKSVAEAGAAQTAAKDFASDINDQLAAQTDHALMIWSQVSTSNPATAWTTDALKTAHNGDYWYKTDLSTWWRYARTGVNTGAWGQITSSATVTWLNASKTANSKSTIWPSYAAAQSSSVAGDLFLDSANTLGYGASVEYVCLTALAATYKRITPHAYGSLSTAPSSGMVANDTYYNSTNFIWYRYSGTAWIASSGVVQYTLTADHTSFTKNRAGAVTPGTITASAKAGTAAYAGRFKFYTTLDGSVYTLQQTSSVDQSSSAAYTLPSTGIVGIRTELYAAGGTTTLLATHDYPVPYDASVAPQYLGIGLLFDVSELTRKDFTGATITDAGVITPNSATTTAVIPGDWLINYSAGTYRALGIYYWSGSAWTITSDSKYTSDGVIEDICRLNNRGILIPDWTVYVNLIADNLFSHTIKLTTKTISDVTYAGVFYGGERFHADGSIADRTANGFYFKTDGKGWCNLQSDDLYNTIIGTDAGLQFISGSGDLGRYNSIYGRRAGQNLTYGFNNCIFGSGAGHSLTTGDNNNLFGGGAGNSLTTGYKNCLFGTSADVYTGAWNYQINLNNRIMYLEFASDATQDTVYKAITHYLTTVGWETGGMGMFNHYRIDSIRYSTSSLIEFCFGTGVVQLSCTSGSSTQIGYPLQVAFIVPAEPTNK